MLLSRTFKKAHLSTALPVESDAHYQSSPTMTPTHFVYRSPVTTIPFLTLLSYSARRPGNSGFIRNHASPTSLQLNAALLLYFASLSVEKTVSFIAPRSRYIRCTSCLPQVARYSGVSGRPTSVARGLSG
jgi:hypothetical protein